MIGCYEDNAKRVLEGGSTNSKRMSVTACRKRCQRENSKFFGVEVRFLNCFKFGYQYDIIYVISRLQYFPLTVVLLAVAVNVSNFHFFFVVDKGNSSSREGSSPIPRRESKTNLL